MKKSKLEKLWLDFANISIDSEDCIENDFYIWEKGTYRFDIWNWFDEKLPNGIIEFFK